MFSEQDLKVVIVAAFLMCGGSKLTDGCVKNQFNQLKDGCVSCNNSVQRSINSQVSWVVGQQF